MTPTPSSGQIVVGVDGSAASAAAVEGAVREAELRHATVRLICAYHSDTRLRAPYASRFWVRQDERQDKRRAAARALFDRAAELASHRLPPVRLIAELVNEPPAQALLDRSEGAEMLVLGTSRPAVQPGQPPLAMGPVARVCLRRAHCPVVVVAPDDQSGDYEPGPWPGTLATSGERRSALPDRARLPLE